MQQLVNGVHRFQRDVFRTHQSLFEGLTKGQSPSTLFVTCSDSRICPQLITQTQPGELFELRVAGNIVPCFGAVRGGEAATIEYAVTVLGVRDIVICGHSFCGAVGALLDDSGSNRIPAVRAYLEHAEATRRIMSENYASVTDPATRLSVAIRENVLVQLENLRTHPAVAAAISRGDLSLHGWVYQFECGHVQSYSPEQDQFVPINHVQVN